MHGKLKVILILLAIQMLVNAGCSVFRQGIRGDEGGKDSEGATVLYSDILVRNILQEGAYISKAGVELQIGGLKDRFTANIRITGNGEYLASIRAFAGLEIGRVYADSDEVVVLDRLGRTATVYKWSKLRSEFGLVYEMIPLIFGDVPSVRNGERRRLDCGAASGLETGWASMDLLPECSLRKASRMILKEGGTGREVVLSLTDFKLSGERVYPGKIEASELSDSFHVKLSLDAIEVPWKGSINFEIPTGYRIIR